MVQQLLAITPLLIIAAGIVMMLLLIAWRRSQKMVAGFTVAILVVALIATINSLSIVSIEVTSLLKVDSFSRLALIWLLLAGLGACYLAFNELRFQIEVHDEYYLLLLLVILGASVLVTSAHYASLFLGFELLSIALIGLVGYFRQLQFSVEASFKYLILSASASSFMLLGIAFIYAQTGSLAFSAPIEHSNILLYQLGFVLLFSGIAFKLSLAPFHYWTPDVYQGATPSVGFVLAIISKCAIFVVIVKCMQALEHAELLNQPVIYYVIFAIAILSMLVGNVLAIGQQQIKRIIAFSSVAHMGYLLILLFAIEQQMIHLTRQSLLFYLLAYLLANLAIFSIMSLDKQARERQYQVAVTDWQGMFWYQPVKATVVILAVLSLVGMPLTAGFIGKFYLVSVAAQQTLWWLLTALIAGSGIALSYYLPLIFTLFKPAIEQDFEQNTISLSQKLWWFMLIVLPLLLGILPDLLIQRLAYFTNI